jgi:hypothetical protein
MTLHWNRFASLGAAMFASILISGCPPAEGTGNDAGPSGDCGDAQECQDDRNCPGGFCEIAEGDDVGCCVQVVCFNDTDC